MHQKEIINRLKNEYKFCVDQNILHETNRLRIIENKEEKELASNLFCGTINQLFPTAKYLNVNCD